MALEIYVPNTGQGDCTLIKFPNGKNMLIDFNKTDVDVDILELIRAKIPKKKHSDIDKTCRRINYFVNTHPHDDHIKGIGVLNDSEFHIDEIWDSGHRLYVPADEKDDYKNYYDYLDLVNKLKRRNSVKVLQAGRAPSYIGTCAVHVFAPSKYVKDAKSKDEIHDYCGVLRLEYKGNAVLFAGDTNRDTWENRIVPHYSDEKVKNGKKLENLLDSTVLHASHHGSKYFFIKNNGNDKDKYKTAMDKITPSFTVISVGAGNKHGHPHRLAMNIYKDKTKYKRAWATKDKKSIFFAFKNDGSIEYKKDLSADDLKIIKCKAERTDSAILASSTTLTFNIGKEIELELPKKLPKPKKEGYR